MKFQNPARILVSAMTTVCLVAAPLSAAAETDEGISSYAQGQFLTGTVAGMSLNTLVELSGATARNDGSAPEMVVRNPLSATVLKSLRVDSTPLTVTGLDGASAGALGQYARAGTKGESFASSGALRDDGAIALNRGDEGSARIQLAPLLGSRLTQNIANLSLSAEAVGAQAQARLTTFTSDYVLAGLKLDFDAPAVTSLSTRALSLLRPIEVQLAELAGSTGPIAHAIDSVLRQTNARLGILDSTAKVTITVDADLRGIIDSAMSAVLQDAAITVNLKSGAISVDLAKLPSTQKLNSMAPGTELLSPVVVADIVNGVMRLLSNHLDGVEKVLRNVLANATVAVQAEVSALDRVKTGDRTVETIGSITHVVDKVTGKVLGILDTDTGVITSLVPGVTGADLDRALKGLLGGLLAKLLGLHNGVVTKVVETVSTTTEPVFSTLETGVNLRLVGTVDQFRTGTGLISKIDVKVLGATVGVNAALVTTPVSAVLQSALLAPTSTVSRTIDKTSTSLIRPIGTVIEGDGANSLQSLLGSAISVKANVQEKVTVPGGGINFTQSALRVSVLNDAATVNLANATVGLNSDNSGGGTGPGDDGTDPDDDPNDDSAGVPGSGHSGLLAFTGAAWTILAILVALALAAVGGNLLLRKRRAATAGPNIVEVE